jgi:hypothetical protein
MSHDVLDTRRPTAAAKAAQQDHDLPLLAQDLNPTVWIDWEPLLAGGIQPALVLGAERRWQGRR